jgi:hypothetical protein
VRDGVKVHASTRWRMVGRGRQVSQ